MSVATGTTPEAIEARVRRLRLRPFKTDVGEAVVALVEPIQARYAELRGDEAELLRLLAVGADKARAASAPTLASDVTSAMGFVRL